MDSHLDQIRTAAVKSAISYGLDPHTFSVVWDEGPASAGPKYAIPSEITEQGSPQHISFWSRSVENSAHPNKPVNIFELDQFIRDYLKRQTELGYAHLFPIPDADGLARRYTKIRGASLEEAIEFPPELIKIRRIPHRKLAEHIKGECHQLTIQRQKRLKASADYLLVEMEAGAYSPAEVADLLATSAKFRVDYKGIVQRIGSDNEHMPHHLDGNLVSRIIGKMREGINTKSALQQAIQEVTKISKDHHGNFTGWRKYRNDSERSAEELNRDLAATNWCTGGDIKTAQEHLSGGNFYIYIETGDPQIAIRTKNNNITEIRGRGQGQALTTQTIRKEAENFLTSGEGPTGGEGYLWDQNFRRSCLKFNNTGEIDDILLTGFDRDGKWIGAQPKMGACNQKEFEEGYITQLKETILPKDRIERRDPNGTVHLLIDYIHEGTTPCYLEYTSIAGNLNARNAKEFNAPNLAHTGGELNAFSAKKFDAPNLTHTGGDLDASHAKRFNAPNLTYIGGALNIIYAREFSAPNLTHVGKSLWAASAREFDAPSLTHIGGQLLTRRARRFNAPSLTHTAGSLDARWAKEFHAPNLEKIGIRTYYGGGWFNIKSATKVDIQKLSYVKDEIFHHPRITLPSALQKNNARRSIALKGQWQAKTEGDQITLNAAALHPEDVEDKIRHELVHRVYSDHTGLLTLERLHASLSKITREKINKIIQEHYPKDEHCEEAHARSFEIHTKANHPNWFGAFLQASYDAWNRLTNKNSIPKKLKEELTKDILQRGITQLK